MLEAIKYTPPQLQVLDQQKLPHESVYVDVCTVTNKANFKIQNSQDGFDAIRSMIVRGAPAIAIVAALSLSIELQSLNFYSESKTQDYISEKLDYLVQARPTAVNLSKAAKQLLQVVQEAETGKKTAFIAAAEKMLADDVANNVAIGDRGAEWLVKDLPQKEQLAVLTHCNTGSLATAGYGTALGIIRSLYRMGRLSMVYCTETRPFNQGSRLTAYELVHEGIPGTLICDSMVASLLSQEKIYAVIVGADRVVRNGDTANKIGTLQLSILARHYNVKFVVAAPLATVDSSTEKGTDIQIEERKGDEVVTIRGPVVKDDQIDLQEIKTVHFGMPGIAVWNPAFDVTPAEYIDAIVTEVGVCEKTRLGYYDMRV